MKSPNAHTERDSLGSEIRSSARITLSRAQDVLARTSVLVACVLYGNNGARCTINGALDQEVVTHVAYK